MNADGAPTLVDTHCHLESFARRGDLDAVLQRATDAGVRHLITVGTSPRDWDLYHALAAAHPGRVAHTAGLHPCDVGPDWRDALALLPRQWEQDPRPVALGEIGLDHFHLPRDADAAAALSTLQRDAFAAQLDLAARLGTRVVVHSRGALAACLETIRAAGFPWERVVFHCFTDGEDDARRVRELGAWMSFTGILTYPKAPEVRAALAVAGIDRILLETDAPYLAPVPHRGKGNEPAFLAHTAAAAARELGTDPAVLAEASTRNARAFYRFPA